MDSELEVIRSEMEATRESLAEKIGSLEAQVRDTVAEAGEAVAATKEGVMDVVSSVTGTVTSVKDSIKETFDLGKQVEAHPWAAFGVAVAVGAVGGALVGSVRQPYGSSPAYPDYPPSRPSYSGVAATAATAAAASAGPGMFDLLFSRVQGLVISSLIDVAKDMIDQSAPDTWKDGLKGAVNDIAAQLNGKH